MKPGRGASDKESLQVPDQHIPITAETRGNAAALFERISRYLIPLFFSFACAAASLVIARPALVTEGIGTRHDTAFRDDLYYLSMARAWGTERYPNFHYRGDHSGGYRTGLPQRRLDPIVRSLFNIGLSVQDCNVVLDFVSMAITIFFFYILFLILTGSRAIGYVAGLVWCCSPFLFADLARGLDPLPIGGIGSVITNSASAMVAHPSHQGPHLQLSLILLSGAIVFGACSLNCRRNATRWLALSGTVSGINVYVYFFAWVVGPVILLPWRVGMGCVTGASLREQIRSIAAFSIPFAVVSLVGAVEMFSSVSELELSGQREFSRFPYLSPHPLVALILLLIIAKLFHENLNRGLLVLAGTLVLGDLVTMNLQFLSGCLMESFHFSVFFFHPLLTLTISAYLVTVLFTSEVLRFVPVVLGTSLIVRQLILTPELGAHLRARNQELHELTDYIRHETPKDAVLVVSAWRKADATGSPSAFWKQIELTDFPMQIASLTQRPILFDITAPGVTPIRREVERELLQGYFEEGVLTLLRDCTAPDQRIFPLLSAFPQARTILWGRMICSESTAGAELSSLLSKYVPSYGVVERGGTGRGSFTSRAGVTHEYSTSTGLFSLYRIDRAVLANSETKP